MDEYRKKIDAEINGQHDGRNEKPEISIDVEGIQCTPAGEHVLKALLAAIKK